MLATLNLITESAWQHSHGKGAILKMEFPTNFLSNTIGKGLAVVSYSQKPLPGAKEAKHFLVQQISTAMNTPKDGKKLFNKYIKKKQKYSVKYFMVAEQLIRK